MSLNTKIISTIIALIAISILAYLGTWQLGRYQEKKNLILNMQMKTNESPIKLWHLNNPELNKYRFTPVIVYGKYLNKYTFLLDNQLYNKQIGYRVLSVVQSPYLDKWILMDRGWISLGRNRQTLPQIQEINDVKEFVGIINTIPSGIVLRKDTSSNNPTWPIRIQSLDFAFIEQNLHHAVYDFVVRLQPNDPTAYAMPAIEFGLPSYKHLGYAVQWYSFACLVLIYYLFTILKKNRD